MSSDLSDGEVELLIGGLADDVAFVWVLIHLGLRGNPPTKPGAPSSCDVDSAFEALERLSRAGHIRVGRTEYMDGGPPGRVAPVKHVDEAIDEVRARVGQACASGEGWEWSCWVVNTPQGDAMAARALENER